MANIVAMLVLASGRGANFNMRAAFLEVLNDALGSLGVIVAAIVIATTGFQRADALAGLFIAMPPAVLAAVTGLALIAPLTGALQTMMTEIGSREAAVLTFAATASSLTLFGVGSAFWGLVVGFAALAAMRRPPS